MLNSLLLRLEKPVFVYGLTLLLVAIYGLFRMTAFTALGGDEAEQVLFAQSFRWGYDVSNPPFYTWILLTLFALFGKSAGLVIALKLAILWSLYIALYRAALLTLGNERSLDAALVALSPTLLFLVAWHAIFSYSHALLNGLLVICTYIALLKIFEDGRRRWYLALGVAMGLGCLSKYSYLLFLVGLMGAILTIPRMRARLHKHDLIAAFAVALVIISPHGLWLLNISDEIQHALDYKLQIGEGVLNLSGIGKGLWNIVRAAFAFLSPLWIVVAIVFPSVFSRKSSPQSHPVAASLLTRTFLLTLALVLAMVVVGGVTQFRPNYMFLFMLFPLWVFVRLPAESVPGVRRQIYGASVLLGAVLSVGGLAAKAAIDPLACGKCQLLVPYKEIAQELRAQGFRGGTLFATSYPQDLPGNLALYMDEARVISKKFVSFRPPVKAGPGQCLSIWVPQEQGGPDLENALGSTEGNLGIEIDRQHPVHRLAAPLYRSADKKVLIDFVLMEPGSGDCR